MRLGSSTQRGFKELPRPAHSFPARQLFFLVTQNSSSATKCREHGLISTQLALFWHRLAEFTSLDQRSSLETQKPHYVSGTLCRPYGERENCSLLPKAATTVSFRWTREAEIRIRAVGLRGRTARGLGCFEGDAEGPWVPTQSLRIRLQ